MKLIVFNGGGGKYNYSLGVLSVLQKNFDLRNCIFSGASSGSFIALLACIDYDADDFFEKWNLKLLNELNDYKLGPILNWNPKIREFCKEFLNDDILNKINDKLYIQLTCVPYLNGTMISHWQNTNEITDTLIATSFIPIFDYGCLTAKYNGKRYIDGGISNNSPIPEVNYSKKLVIDPNKWRKLPKNSFWTLYGSEHPTNLFEMGKKDALDNLEEIKVIFE